MWALSVTNSGNIFPRYGCIRKIIHGSNMGKYCGEERIPGTYYCKHCLKIARQPLYRLDRGIYLRAREYINHNSQVTLRVLSEYLPYSLVLLVADFSQVTVQDKYQGFLE